MSKKLYIGNLPWSIKTEDLEEMFSQVGPVADAFVMTDRETGRSRGFGFVTFENEGDEEKAIEMFNGKMVGDPGRERELVVNVARPKPDRY